MKSNFVFLDLVQDLIIIFHKFGCIVPTAQTLVRYHLEEVLSPIADKFGLSTVECAVLAVAVFERKPCNNMPRYISSFFSTDNADALEIELKIWKSMTNGSLSKYFEVNREQDSCIFFKHDMTDQIFKDFTVC